MPAGKQLISFVALALALVACDSAEEASGSRAPRSVPVIVEPLRMEREQTRVEAVGTSRAAQSIAVRAAASGEVIAVRFSAGQAVSRGQVLIELDSRDERLAVGLAEVRLADAERLLARYQRSGASGAILPTDLDAARTAVESARIDLQRSQVALQDRNVVAQFDGYVDLTDIEPGDRITTDTLITTLDNRDQLLVDFAMPEAVFEQLKPGNPVGAVSWSGRSVPLQGEVVDVASRIDPTSRTFSVRAAIPNPDDRLRPGMSFRVSVDIKGESYPVIAETAVSWGADGAFIWRITDGSAERIAVNIVQRQKGRILLDVADVHEGDLVVVEGTQRMRAGVSVDYRNRDTVNVKTQKTDEDADSGAVL